MIAANLLRRVLILMEIVNTKVLIAIIAASAAGFVAGTSRAGFISPAHAAAGKNTILRLSDNNINEVAEYCDFDKTIVSIHSMRTVICVAK
jgi:hypothetical protein